MCHGGFINIHKTDTEHLDSEQQFANHRKWCPMLEFNTQYLAH